MSLETVPKDLRGLRACLVCSLIKTFDQFEYDGMIAVMSPEDSWVCKWQRINRFCKGVYAISVSGRLPAGVIRDMKSRGYVYRPRDTSQR
ncbi:hypothetical protein SFRURICE_005930 [Spodoptera frugiperda]|nr:hypothetical protein SFRURICE_005930 [Spodoptera frugiperda]